MGRRAAQIVMKKAVVAITSIALFAGAVNLICLYFFPAPKNNIQETAGIHFAYSGISDLYGDLATVSPTADGQQKYGGISSHHFLVAKEIAKFFAGLKVQNPKTIVILGPNHFSRGQANILVSRYAYRTPWGDIQPEISITDSLVRTGVAENEELPFEGEHAISALVGFIKYYIPDAKLVPIILKHNTSQTQAELLVNELDKLLPADSFVLASADFSHHVDRTTAVAQDKISIVAITNFDYETILSLASTQLDSPPAIYALLKYLDRRGAKKMSFYNTNAADFTGNPELTDVTSYVFAYFSKD
jgi:hypothetical protein